MAPASIEAAIKAQSPLIAHIVAVGDRRPYNVALIVLDRDVRRAAAAPTTPRSPASSTRRSRAETRSSSRVEQIKRFRILAEEWAPAATS